MKQFLLIRHAQSLANVGASDDHDSALTDIGRLQAQDLANFVGNILKPGETWRGFVSPFQRALATAHPIYETHGIPFSPSWDLREMEHSVPPENPVYIPKSRDEFDWLTDQSTGSWEYQKETREAFLSRIRRFIESVSEIENAIVVSHGLPVLALAEHLIHGEVQWPDTWHDQYPNTSVTQIVDGQARLHAYDDFLRSS